MKIIKPNYEILTPVNRKEILKFIEMIGRTCYKSEDKITENSAEKFINKCDFYSCCKFLRVSTADR